MTQKAIIKNHAFDFLYSSPRAESKGILSVSGEEEALLAGQKAEVAFVGVTSTEIAAAEVAPAAESR